EEGEREQEEGEEEREEEGEVIMNDGREETGQMEEMEGEERREEEMERSGEQRKNIADISHSTLNYREPEDSHSFAPPPRFVLEVDTPVTNDREEKEEEEVMEMEMEADEVLNFQNEMLLIVQRESRRNAMDLFLHPSNGRREALMEREMAKVLEESMELATEEKEKNENENPVSDWSSSSSHSHHHSLMETPKSSRASTRSRGTMREVKKVKKVEEK
ncbi:hypothetical protein PFISCL1PPCAC_285, partial [Pristionchus fissidentatus]